MTTATAAAGHQPECSDPADPLSRYSMISLFPRTLGILRDAPRPYDLDSDLDSLHDHLASVAMRSPGQLLVQARAIVEKKSEMLNDDIGNRKKRRPGLPSHLRAQRPRFSLKPDFTSQSAVNLLANLEFDVDKYEDPVECFDAYEKFETTKRELEKLAGVVLDPNQHSIAGNGRPRRPGLSRSARWSSSSVLHSLHGAFAGDMDITVSPQRTWQKDATGTESPLSALLPEEVESVKLTELAVTRSTGAENVAGAPSADVFSSIFEDLDVDGADIVNVLQERLQIKPFYVKSLHFPEMQDLQHNEVKTPGSDSSKPRWAYLQNILNSVRSESPSKNERSIRSQLSPTPLKSPLTVMNLLRKPLAEISSSIDPVSPDNLEEPAGGISQRTVHSAAKSPNAKRGNYSGFAVKSALQVPEEIGDALHDIPQTENCAQNAGHFSGKDTCDSFGGKECNVNIGPIRRNMDKDDDSASLAGDENSGVSSRKEGSDAGLRKKSVDVGDGTNTQAAAGGAVSSSNIEECDVRVNLSQIEVHIESPMECLSKEAGKSVESPTANISGHLGKDQEKTRKTLTKGMNGKQGRGRKRVADSRRQTSAADQNLSVTEGLVPGKSHVNPDELDEVLPEESLADQQKEGARPPKVRKRKELNRRQSLAAAGTSWSGGVRRSTRIKSRPLEYWKGERFLYGRVHQTLATVIGIKYASPGKADGEASFKVKSFVSDQYKDLVDLVALH